MRRYWPLAVFSMIWVVLDQWTKVLAVRAFVLPDGTLPEEAHQIRTDVMAVTENWFNLRVAGNTGAAFSMFGDWPAHLRLPFFVGIAVVAVVLLVYMYGKADTRVQKVAFVLVLGGAIGNVIDRVRYGYVVDFIQWYWKDFVWPTFNVADIGISVGVGLLLIDAFIPRPDPEDGEGSEGAPAAS